MAKKSAPAGPTGPSAPVHRLRARTLVRSPVRRAPTTARRRCGTASSVSRGRSANSSPPQLVPCTPTCSSARPARRRTRRHGRSPRCSSPESTIRINAMRALPSPASTPTCARWNARRAISAEQVNEIIRNANLAPVEGERKVMVLHEFHLLDATGAARLLKTLEEPPPSTVFIVLADQVPPELVTIASRCVRIEFSHIPDPLIESTLIAEGTDAAVAANAAASARGDLDRARLLAIDPGLMERRDTFAGLPARLDGTGRTVVALCAEVAGLIDKAATPLAKRQAEEVTRLEARVRELGERGSGRKQLEERHKRELRRHRIDEWRNGLAVMAGVVPRRPGGRLAAPTGRAPAQAVHRIHAALEALDRNPNEILLLQSLLLDLPSLG